MEQVIDRTPAQEIQNYSFSKTGGQPLDILKDYLEQFKEAGEFHPAMNAKRYELVSVPKGINYDEFISTFLQYKGEQDVIYIAIMNLSTRLHSEKKYGPTGKVKTDNFVTKGARNWKTYHVVYRDTKVEGETGWEELGKFETKGEAMDFGRDHANKTGDSVWVELEKRLIGSKSRVADMKPEIKSYIEQTEVPHNSYLFFGKGATS